MDLSNSTTEAFDATEPAVDAGKQMAEQMLNLLINDLRDGVDHPEIWRAMPEFLEKLPALSPLIRSNQALLNAPNMDVRIGFTILWVIARALAGDISGAQSQLEPLSTRFSESPLVQGAVFHLQSLADPENPKYALEEKFCIRPFHEIDVLERGSHLCCASWLNLSVGDMSSAQNWQQVWNSHNAERIRASVHDGSFRHCNKTACPAIQANLLPAKDEVAKMSDHWKMVVEEQETCLPVGPEKVNLAYDRTCNLSCPSCRTEKYAADAATRERFDRLQEHSILPMLKDARSVFITGSGDPFSSKNFRQLMERLGPDEYPDLRFIVMTNGMLFTRREWDRFPALHNRVQSLQISIDAATGPTHELLRRGARWPVMLENMKFAAELLKERKIEQLHLCYTVQTENYAEMGDAVDLADELEATGVYFGRITNWGTFSAAEYERKAVFAPSHPLYTDFIEKMRDPRLTGKRVHIGNLIEFIPQETRWEKNPERLANPATAVPVS